MSGTGQVLNCPPHFFGDWVYNTYHGNTSPIGKGVSKLWIKGVFAVAMAIVIALIVAGCGSAQEVLDVELADSSSHTGESHTESEATAQTEGVPDRNLSVEVGPLDEYLVRMGRRTIGQSSEEASITYNAQLLLESEILAECMATHGFEYIPGIWEDRGSDDFDWDALTVQVDSREFAATYGFGIAVDWSGIRRPLTVISGPDPNVEIFESLSPAAQAEYWQTKQGICAPLAWEEVFLLPQTGEFSGLADEVNRLTVTIDSDPRVSALNQQWATCMENEGFNDFWAPGIHLRRQLSFENDGDLTVERELAIAVADWDCRESLDYDSTRWMIRNQLQYEFVDRHAAELEAWVLFEQARHARN